VTLIAYGRPGYGGSERHEGRSVVDAASDVKAIADDLGLDRFCVVGRSGGGPHALACAATLADRVISTAVLVGLAPSNAAGLDWYQGMSQDNVSSYSTADEDSAALKERLRIRADLTLSDPQRFIGLLRSQMPDSDKRIIDQVSLRRLIAESYREGLREGPYGWIDDVMALRHDWGFSFQAITGPVLLWHGAEDVFSPTNHTRWLARQISTAEVRVQPDAAHFDAMPILPDILAWAIAHHQRHKTTA
jgi:pimeloyl-ACP methyl ester carboxylesterase